MDISDEIASLAAEEGARQAVEFTNVRRVKYLNSFIQLRNEILKSYNLKIDSIQKRYAFGKMAKQMISVEIYPSSKGGGNVLPFDEIKKIKEKIISQNEQLSQAREMIYGFKQNNEVKKLSMKLMGLTLMLKQDIEQSKEEHFAFIYSGDSNVTSVITVPMHTILFKEGFDQFLNLEFGNINRWNGAEDQRLRFNSSILEQLKQTQGAKTFNLQDDFSSRYNTAKDQGYEKIIRTKSNKRKERLEQNGYVYREQQGQYWIVAKTIQNQTGFISQGLFSEFIQDASIDIIKQQNGEFRPDNNPWYGLADSTSKNGLGYSVKSFLEGDPGLVSLNSLYQVTDIIIKKLGDKTLNIKGVKDYLKQSVFSGARIVTNAFNKDLNEIIEKFMS